MKLKKQMNLFFNLQFLFAILTILGGIFYFLGIFSNSFISIICMVASLTFGFLGNLWKKKIKRRS